MPTNLLPCPHCGGNGRPDYALRGGYTQDSTDPDALAHYIVCDSCAGQGGWAKSESGAIRNWNMRCPPDISLIAMRIVETHDAFRTNCLPQDYTEQMIKDIDEIAVRYRRLSPSLGFGQASVTARAEFIQRVLFGLR